MKMTVERNEIMKERNAHIRILSQIIRHEFLTSILITDVLF